MFFLYFKIVHHKFSNVQTKASKESKLFECYSRCSCGCLCRMHLIRCVFFHSMVAREFSSFLHLIRFHFALNGTSLIFLSLWQVHLLFANIFTACKYWEWSTFLELRTSNCLCNVHNSVETYIRNIVQCLNC